MKLKKLKNKNCFVITRPELGWDCVTGVYFAIDEDSVMDYLVDDYNDDNIIHEESLSIIDKDSDECFVITRPELGWDCVTGVYFAKSEKSLIKYLGDDYNEDNEVIHSVSYDVITTKSEIRDEQIKKVIE